MRELRRQGANVDARTWGQCDLRTMNETFELFYEVKPRIVFHLAAKVGGIGATNSRAGQYFYDNMAMGMNVIECCRLYSVEKLIVAGSVCEYPSKTPIPMNERDIWEGKPEETNAPYGIAKKAILSMQEAYEKQYSLHSTHFLQANLYGMGDDFSYETSHVIPALIKRFVDAKLKNFPEVIVWGSGEASRDFLYAEDAVSAYIRAAERITTPREPINLGTGRSTKINYLATLIARYIGYEGDIVYDKSKPDGQMERRLDISRAKHILDWTPTTPFNQGLYNVIDWYVNEQYEAEQ